MMVTVMEDTIASDKETTASPEFSIQDCATDSQRTSFCDSDRNSNVETMSRTYTDVEDTLKKAFNANQKIDDDEEEKSSYSDLLLTAYLPLVLLWFRRSMFGPANLIRSIVVGQLMRLVFVGNISEWISEKLHSWLGVIIFHSSATGTIKGANTGNVSALLGAGGGKIDPHAWPPPAFTALALLTIFALVVHPDGLTWIMLGRLRDAAYVGFSILGHCLEYLLNDYGLIPTIIAGTTLATMFFLVFVVIRTLSPKKTINDLNKRDNTLHNERKKKKKKGGNARQKRENHHYRSNRIKLSSQSQPHTAEEVGDAITAARPRSPIPAQPPSKMENDTSSLPPSSKDTMDSPISLPSLSISSPTMADNIESNEDIKEIIGDKGTTTSGMNKPKENRSRRRMMSGSTLDTTPLSDDQSCGSISVRSFPSVSVTSGRSIGGCMSHKNTKESVTTPRRVKRQGIAKSPKNAERNSGKKKKIAVVESSMSSRWDALKPEHGNGSRGNNNGYNHHNANGNSINKKQHQHQRHPRGNSRRNKGNHGNGQNRKGRQNQKTVIDEKQKIDKNSIGTIPVSSPGSSLRVNNARPNINEVSPIVPADPKKNPIIWSSSSNTNPIINVNNIPSKSNSKPPPPPGFKKVSLAKQMEKKSSARHRRQQQGNNRLSVPTLFESPSTIQPLSDTPQNDFARPTNAMVASQHSADVITPAFFHRTNSDSPSTGLLNGVGSSGTIIQDNPFSSNIRDFSASSNNYNNINSYQANLDSQIEADLQELGGQMAGSILDF